MDEKLKMFGKRVALLRANRNITQERLAELIGYSPNHISKLESARTNPSFDLIIKIADALNIQPKELFDYEQTPTEELDIEIMHSIKSLNLKEKHFIFNTIKNLKKLFE